MRYIIWLLEALMDEAPTEETMWNIVKAMCMSILASVSICLFVYLLKKGILTV